MHSEKSEDGDGIQITMRLWTFAEVKKALPYLRAILRPLRDQWLEIQRSRLFCRRLSEKAITSEDEGQHGLQSARLIVQTAEEHFAQALGELVGLDVYTLDPLRGIALLPFRHGDSLAWFVYDMFSEDGIETWRFHSDTLETRRPIETLSAA